ncbi:MAG TPA: Asp-tRNA(Asn)/Glu-tRNA(Gln) amidotransferase subunit GatC [Candidatus Dormibacteraeota bacterium]|nr:Asp-tRNA(Asn)/Glu-tRNA(Gln) amidotransferase subunit GatC [Candidatus Dormibacteraeota bacterium]
MSLTDAEIAHVATLARLGLSEEERARYGAQLAAILEHMRILERVDVGGVPETAQVGGLVNVWREDRERPSTPVDALLDSAPDRDGNAFRVGAIQE